MKYSYLLIINLILSSILLFFFLYWLFSPKTNLKFAYVRTAVLIDKYLGTKEAQKKFEKKTEVWQAGADTLKKRFQESLDSLKKMGIKDLDKASQQKMQQKQMQIENYENSIRQNMQTEEQKAMDGVFKQVNIFIEQYAKDKNIDVVLGTTQQGSLLYGNKSLDITDEVVDGLNKQYRK